MGSSSSSSSGRHRANTFSGGKAAKSPTSPYASGSGMAGSFDRECAIGGDNAEDDDEYRPRAYSTNTPGMRHSYGDSACSSRRSSGGQIFHFNVERRPSVAGRLLSFLGAKPEPKRCEIAIKQLTPLEASEIPSSAEIKNMELLLIGQEGVGKKEIVKSLLTAATVPSLSDGENRGRLASIDSEISWDEQTCIFARSYLEVDCDYVNFTARCAANENELERCLSQSIPDAVLAVYSVIDANSVLEARSLLNYAACRTPKRTALCMIANKADLSGLAGQQHSSQTALNDSPIRRSSSNASGASASRSTGRAAAKSVGASWLETSAVISLNIRTLLAALLQHWIHNSGSTITEEKVSLLDVAQSHSGSIRSNSKSSRSNSLRVSEPNRDKIIPRGFSEKRRSSSKSGKKVARHTSSSALVSACHPILSAICVAKSSKSRSADDRNSNSNSGDSGVHDSPALNQAHVPSH